MIQRGDIWWASLPASRKSEPGFRRPVLVVQTNSFNKGRISTVVVAAITSNIRLAEAPGNVLLKRRRTGLTRESVINVSQLLTIDKSLLTDRIGVLPTKVMVQIDAGLRLVLSL